MKLRKVITLSELNEVLERIETAQENLIWANDFILENTDNDLTLPLLMELKGIRTNLLQIIQETLKECDCIEIEHPKL